MQIGAPPSPMSSSALNLSSCSADRSIDDIFGGMSVNPTKDSNPSTEPLEIGCLPPPPSPPLSFDVANNDRLEDKTDVMKPVPAPLQPPTPNQPMVEYTIPKTGVQFANTWKGLEEHQRFHFLRQVQEKSTTKIIGKLGASLDDSLLTELLDCLHSYFCPKDLNIGDILVQVSENSEIGILAMMMGYVERRTVEDLLSYVRNRQELSAEVCSKVERAFSG